MLKSPWIRKPDFKNIGPLDYEASRKEHADIAARLRPREVIMLKMVPRGASVLDIGCGVSRLPLALKEKGVRISVADISKTAVSLYARYGISGKVIDIEDIKALKKLGQYDYLIASEVLEHVRLPEEVIRELAKHTKYFLLTIPNSAAYVFRYGLMVRGRFFTQWLRHPSEHLRFWSHIDFLDWLSAMGIVVEQVVVADGFTLRGRLPWLPNLWKNLLGYRMVYVGRVRSAEVP